MNRKLKTQFRRRRRAIPGAVLALLLPAIAFLPACGHQADGARTGSMQESRPDSGGQAQLFTVPEDQMSHVEMVTIEPATLARDLRLTGTVNYNSFQTTPVISQISGPVSRVLVYPGQTVHSGQPMLYVSSPDYSQLRANYLKDWDAFNVAKENYSRAEDLYQHHAISQMDLLQAQSSRNQTQADLQAAEQSLRVLGVKDLDRLTKGPATPDIPVLAPIEGEVVERTVSAGQVIQAGATQVFTISDMRTVWVLASVYERDLAAVHMGDAVAIRSDAYPEVFGGRISYIAPALDPSTRTLQVRIDTRNPGEKLKKDMYVTAVVHAGAIRQALAVPDAAVLRNDENEPFVYLATGPNTFAQRLVTIGESENGKTRILAGLREGERVVADGSLFLQFANSFQR